jgi:hypothetical protein
VECSAEDGGNGDWDEVSEAGEEEEGEESGDTNGANEVVRDDGVEDEDDGGQDGREDTSERCCCPSGGDSWACKPRSKKSTNTLRIICRVCMAIIDD